MFIGSALAIVVSCTTDYVPPPDDGDAGQAGVAPQGGSKAQGGAAGVAGTADIAGSGGSLGPSEGGTAGESPDLGGTNGGGESPGVGGESAVGGAPAEGGAGGSAPVGGVRSYVFLTFGQSNMVGAPAPEATDKEPHPRVQVLAYDNCAGLGRTYDEWYPAVPPLHNCTGGLGPADYFGRVIADALPNVTVGIVPNAINGADIDMFRKGVTSTRRGQFRIPPDNHWGGAYEWMVERAKVAQEWGEIRGIIFHQGESDNTSGTWVARVKEIVADLKEDLDLPEDTPFLAGELPYGGCCNAHNPVIAELPSQVPNAHVISAEGLDVLTDKLHFDLPSQRTFGQRYGEKMLELLEE